MKSIQFRSGLVMACVLSTASLAQAAPPPIQVFVDGTSVGTVSWINDLSVPGAFTTAQTFLGAGNSVNLGQAFLAPVTTAYGAGWDFSYGLGFVTNDRTSSTLKVIFDLPSFASAITNPATGVSSLIGTLVSPTGSGSTITAPASGTVQTVIFTPAASGLSIGPSATFAGISGTYGVPDAGNPGSFLPYQTSASLPSGLSNMTVVAEFTLAPNSQALALDGNVLITPVPESQALAMMLAGFGVLGFLARRRGAA